MSILDLLPTWRAWLTFVLVVFLPLAIAWLVSRVDDSTLVVTDDTGRTTRIAPIE